MSRLAARVRALERKCRSRSRNDWPVLWLETVGKSESEVEAERELKCREAGWLGAVSDYPGWVVVLDV